MKNSNDVSAPLNTYNPNTQGKFSMVRNKSLYEFGYTTDYYLANKSEYIYTRITTISPHYIVKNLTKKMLYFAQTTYL